MSYLKSLMAEAKKTTARVNKIKLRKHLNADALFATMRTGFNKIKDHRSGKVQHSLADTLMAGFAMFSVKDPSLLAFDERRRDKPQNLKTIYGMNSIPCDTSMREILDGVSPDDLRPLFKDAFRPLQRGKVLEKMIFMEDSYL
ncbi:transposase, partial [Desulfobacterota bacterium M19]